MPVSSQTVLTDTITFRTVLDKKATIATGNLLKEGEGFKSLYFEQSVLVDSLILESLKRKNENETFREKIVPELELLNKEQKKELGFVKESYELKTELLQSELKREKGKKWTFGVIGISLGVLTTLLALAF